MSVMTPPDRPIGLLKPFIWLAVIAFLTGFWAVLLTGAAGAVRNHAGRGEVVYVPSADLG